MLSVHEYGGGSFIVVDDAPYFITPDGIFKQVAADMEPELIVVGDYSHRFADLCYYKVVYGFSNLLKSSLDNDTLIWLILFDV